jgi:transcriptional regulator with XRE-family HTH domain
MLSMPTVVSHAELEELMRLVAEYRDRTGESVTAIADRAGVRRGQLSQLLSGNYPHAPHFEVVAKIANAIGRRVAFVPNN